MDQVLSAELVMARMTIARLSANQNADIPTFRHVLDLYSERLCKLKPAELRAEIGGLAEEVASIMQAIRLEVKSDMEDF